MEEGQTPGLKWRKRANGERVPYWLPSKAAVDAGYPVKSANLGRLADNPKLLSDRCKRLQGEMLLWLETRGHERIAFDGTIGAVLDIYETHQESPFRNLKPSSRHPYSVYLAKLRAAIGARRVTAVTGLDIRRWFKAWSEPDREGGKEKIAAARMAMTVLKSALTFGAICALPGCAALREAISLTRFKAPPPRKFAPTAELVTAARKAAREIGRPSLALAYAIQFETVLRQWDVIGRWIALSDPTPSAVIRSGEKWIGLSWSHIDKDLILTFTPSKTEDTTEATVVHDLKLCPMVLEELQSVPPEKRVGPVIIDERTGAPYSDAMFTTIWRRDIRKRAGIPAGMWNRDIRAGGITEGRKSAAHLADVSKMAGHAKEATTARVYERDVLEASRRVQRARIASRNDGGTGRGT